MTNHTLEHTHTHTHTHRYSEQSNRVVNNRPDPILKEKRPKRESADLWTQLRGAVVYVSRRVQLMKMCCEPEDATSFRAKWSENQIQFHDLWNAIGYEKEAKRWIKCAHSRSGRMYYFNLITEESSWTKPSVIALYVVWCSRMPIVSLGHGISLQHSNAQHSNTNARTQVRNDKTSNGRRTYHSKTPSRTTCRG